MTLGLFAAGALGLIAFTAPASAMPAFAPGLATGASSGIVTEVQYRHRRHRHCTVKNVVERRHGRRIVKKVRVCR
jgi:hypothetical protein